MNTRSKVAIVILAAAVAAAAHHSAAPFYDSTKSVEAQGGITKFLVKNPHSFLYFEADENGKKVEWQIELGTAAGMAR